jgi:hypothetical protein
MNPSYSSRPKFQSMSMNEAFGVDVDPLTPISAPFAPTGLLPIENIDASIPQFVEFGHSGDRPATGISYKDDRSNKACGDLEQLLTPSSMKAHSHGVGDRSSSPHHALWTALSHLPPVPQYAPLERTALRLMGTPLEAAICRIAHFMKMNSICCVYHTTEARVDCLTCWGLKFVVQLWKDTSNDAVAPPASDEAVAILEVQRRRGCCVAMRNVRRRLYRAVTASGTRPPDGVLSGGGRRWKPPHVHDDSFARVQTACRKVSLRFLGHQIHDEKKCSMDDPDLVRPPRGSGLLELLEGTKVDDNRLGMDMLLFALTHPDRVGGCFSDGVARGLAFGEPPRGTRLRVGYMKFFRPPPYRRLSNGADCSESQDVSALDGTPSGGNCELQEIHLVSLKVMWSCLARIIEVEQDYLCNEARMLNLSSDFWMDVLDIFVLHLEDCSQRPQEAALSAGCLRKLETLQPFLLTPPRRVWTMQTVMPPLRAAREFGVRHHLLLEQEARDLIEYVERAREAGDDDDSGRWHHVAVDRHSLPEMLDEL